MHPHPGTPWVRHSAGRTCSVVAGLPLHRTPLLSFRVLFVSASPSPWLRCGPNPFSGELINTLECLTCKRWVLHVKDPAERPPRCCPDLSCLRLRTLSVLFAVRASTAAHSCHSVVCLPPSLSPPHFLICPVFCVLCAFHASRFGLLSG